MAEAVAVPESPPRMGGQIFGEVGPGLRAFVDQFGLRAGNEAAARSLGVRVGETPARGAVPEALPNVVEMQRRGEAAVAAGAPAPVNVADLERRLAALRAPHLDRLGPPPGPELPEVAPGAAPNVADLRRRFEALRNPEARPEQEALAREAEAHFQGQALAGLQGMVQAGAQAQAAGQQVTQEQLAQVLANLQAVAGAVTALQQGQQQIAQRQEAHIGMTGRIAAGTEALQRHAVEAARMLRENLDLSRAMNRKLDQFRGGGYKGFLKALLLDEFNALILYMILHPYFPITIESITYLWFIILLAKRTYTGGLRSNIGNIIANVVSVNLSGTIKSLFFNPSNAIILLYFLNAQFVTMRSSEDPLEQAEYARLFPGGGEAAVGAFIGSVVSSAQGFRAGTYTISAASEDAIAALRAPITRFYLGAKGLRGQITAACPQFKDPAVFSQCVIDYMSGNLKVMTANGIVQLAPPGLLTQVTYAVKAEVQFMHIISSLMYELVRIACGPTFDTVVGGVEATINGVKVAGGTIISLGKGGAGLVGTAAGAAAGAARSAAGAVGSAASYLNPARFFRGGGSKTRSVAKRHNGTRRSRSPRIDPVLSAVYTRAYLSTQYMVANLMETATDGRLGVPKKSIDVLGLYLGIAIGITESEKYMGAQLIPMPPMIKNADNIMTNVFEVNSKSKTRSKSKSKSKSK